MKNERKKSLIAKITEPCWLIDEESSFRDKFIRKFSKLFYIFPKPVRKKVFFVFDNFIILLTRVIRIISRISLNAYLISGKEKHSGKKLTILLFSNENLSAYLLDLLFLENPNVEKKFNVKIWNYQKKIEKIQQNLDAIIIKNDRFYANFFEKQGFTIIPEWISLKLDISIPLDSIYKNVSKSVKEDIKKVEKNNYDYEISEDLDKFKLFYNKMYLPYVSWRYGASGIYVSFETIKHFYEQGSKILLIKKDNEFLFGGLFTLSNNKVNTLYAGVADGKFEYIKKGIFVASYNHLIKYSKEIGVSQINLGACRSFVNDGVFIHKRKWGTKINPKPTGHESAEIFSFKSIGDSPAIDSFLKNNPFISLESNSTNIKRIERE